MRRLSASISSWRGDAADTFKKRMSAALENREAVVQGRLERAGDKTPAHVTVAFRAEINFPRPSTWFH